MSRDMRVTGYSVERIAPDKSYAVWVTMEPNIVSPVCYLKKPKWLTDEQWESVVKSIKLDATPDFLVCGDGGMA